MLSVSFAAVVECPFPLVYCNAVLCSVGANELGYTFYTTREVDGKVGFWRRHYLYIDQVAACVITTFNIRMIVHNFYRVYTRCSKRVILVKREHIILHAVYISAVGWYR